MFEEDYLDIDHWPHRWCVESCDLLAGRRMLDVFKIFMYDLLSQRLARKTLLLHRDHLCTLGETIVHRLHTNPQLRRRDMQPVLLVFIAEDGGPLLCPRRSAEQRSFDSTCMKLRRFLRGPRLPSG